MDNAQPYRIVLHIDVVTPYDERRDLGWDLDNLESELREVWARHFQGPWTRDDLRLDSIEIEEDRHP